MMLVNPKLKTHIEIGATPFNVVPTLSVDGKYHEDGVVITCTGKVCNHNLTFYIDALILYLYPGMKKKAIAEILRQVR
ncbi:MAG: hypothetical protein ACFC03_02435 [Candidatus Malihini olakiniferum]